MAMASNTSRKRSRHDYIHSTQTTPYTVSSTGWSTSFTPSTISPAPLANSRYQLAGGLDTPTAAQQAISEKYDNRYELEYRRGRPYNDSAKFFGETEQLPAPLARESNGRPRAQVNPTAKNGWSLSVFSTLTGAAGKVWDFCRSGSTFRGFFAGGGQGYAMETPMHLKQELRKSPSGGAWEDDDGSPMTPMPGDYPTVPYIEDYMDSPERYSERAAKKSKHSYKDEGNMSNSWIMVQDTPTRRKVPVASTASPAPMRRPASKAGMRRTAPAPPMLSPVRPASAAGLRAPATPRLGHHHSRTNSRELGMSPRSSRNSTQAQPDSPIAREAAKHMEQMRRSQRKEDKEMMQFNKRLQDMIKEGKEALGSKIEIEMEGSDEDMW